MSARGVAWPYPYWLDRVLNSTTVGAIPTGTANLLFPVEAAIGLLCVLLMLVLAACVADQHHRWWRMVGREWGLHLKEAEARRELRRAPSKCTLLGCCAKRRSAKVVPAAVALLAEKAVAESGGAVEMTVLGEPLPKAKDLRKQAIEQYHSNHLLWVQEICRAVEGGAAPVLVDGVEATESSDDGDLAAPPEAATAAAVAGVEDAGEGEDAANSTWTVMARRSESPIERARTRVVDAREAIFDSLGEDRGGHIFRTIARDPLAFESDTRLFVRELVNAFADVRLHEVAAAQRVVDKARSAAALAAQHAMRRRYRIAAAKACASRNALVACHAFATFARRATLDHVHLDTLASLSLLSMCSTSVVGERKGACCPRRPAESPRRNRRIALALSCLGVLLAMAINVVALTQFEIARLWWRDTRSFVGSNATQASVAAMGFAPLSDALAAVSEAMAEEFPWDANALGLYTSVAVSTLLLSLLSWWLSALENGYTCGCGGCTRASRALRRELAVLEVATKEGRAVQDVTAVARDEAAAAANALLNTQLALAIADRAVAPPMAAATAALAVTTATAAVATMTARPPTAADDAPRKAISISGMPAPAPPRFTQDIKTTLSIGEVTAIGLGVGGALAIERAFRKGPTLDELVPSWMDMMAASERDRDESDSSDSSSEGEGEGSDGGVQGSARPGTAGSMVSFGGAGLAPTRPGTALTAASRVSYVRPAPLRHGKHLVGLAVQKSFPQGMFDGVVSEMYPGLPGVEPLYRVLYTDGEEEDFELDELEALLFKQAAAEVRAATAASLRPATAPLDVQPRSKLCSALLSAAALRSAEQFQYEANPLYDPSTLLANKVVRKCDDVAIEDGAFVKRRDGWTNGTVLLKPAAKKTGVTVWTFHVERGKRMTLGLARKTIPLDNFLNSTPGGWGVYQYSGRIGHAGPADTLYAPSFRCTDTDASATPAPINGATLAVLGDGDGDGADPAGPFGLGSEWGFAPAAASVSGSGGAIDALDAPRPSALQLALSGDRAMNEVRMEYDADARTLTFVINGVNHGVAFTSVPSNFVPLSEDASEKKKKANGEISETVRDQKWKKVAAAHAVDVLAVAKAAAAAAKASRVAAFATARAARVKWAGLIELPDEMAAISSSSSSDDAEDDDEDDDSGLSEGSGAGDDGSKSGEEDEEDEEGSAADGSNSDDDDDNDDDDGDGDTDDGGAAGESGDSDDDKGEDGEKAVPRVPPEELAAVDGGAPLYAAITLAHAGDRVLVLVGDSDETLLRQQPVVFDGVLEPSVVFKARAELTGGLDGSATRVPLGGAAARPGSATSASSGSTRPDSARPRSALRAASSAVGADGTSNAEEEESVLFVDALVPFAEELYLAAIAVEVLEAWPLRDPAREKRWNQRRRCVGCCATLHGVVGLCLLIDAIALIAWVGWSAVGIAVACTALAFGAMCLTGWRAAKAPLRSAPATAAVQFMALCVIALVAAVPLSALDYTWGEAPLRAAWDAGHRTMTAQQHETEVDGSRPTWPPLTPTLSDATTWWAALRWPARYLADDLQATLGCCGFDDATHLPLSLPCPYPNASIDAVFYVAPATALVRLLASQWAVLAPLSDVLGNASSTDCRAIAQAESPDLALGAVPGCFPVLRCYARYEASTLSVVTGVFNTMLQLGLDQVDALLASTAAGPYFAMARPYLSLAGWWTASPQLVFFIGLELLSFIAVVRMLLYPPYLGAPREKARCRGCCGCDCWPKGCCLNPLCGCRYQQCGDDALASFGDDDGTSDAANELSVLWGKFRTARCWCDRDDVAIAEEAATIATYTGRPGALCARRWKVALCNALIAAVVAVATLLALVLLVLFGVDDFDSARWLQLVAVSTACTFVALLAIVALGSAVEAAVAACAACAYAIRALRVAIPAETATVGIARDGGALEDHAGDAASGAASEGEEEEMSADSGGGDGDLTDLFPEGDEGRSSDDDYDESNSESEESKSDDDDESASAAGASDDGSGSADGDGSGSDESASREEE